LFSIICLFLGGVSE